MKISRTLTPDEQTALFRELRAAADPLNHPARERLITENLPLAMKVWREVAPPTARLLRHREDMRSVAFLALVNAVDGFDPGRGWAFGTYLASSVKRNMLVYLLRHGGALTMPYHTTWDRMRERSGKPVKSPECLEAAKRAAEDAGPVEPWTVTAAGGTDEVDDRDEAEAAARRVEAMLATLDRREAAVVRLRYGIGGGEPASLRAVAAVVGVSYQAVGAIEQRAVGKLRRAARSE